ncbi:hypothetical protein N0V93_007050 [Gnomoniopsis smithogilvyi]|uniref:Zn(2)-C6 fungal-type domain-containing protein n=1 Tax=Gnomoniopsis smithogilvyi TaxID=1191159 RepID=A0A9W8YQJ8_9PEZI|nr:hypothetical protein N0V93_007050 [Gnomoniopsis smithogilvyi]
MQSVSRGKLSSGQSTPSRTAVAAPYGHACTNCARAKCKCIYAGGQAGAICERCLRLSKTCQPSVPNRKRNPRKAPGSRTAHLEEKLDDLVSLIRSQANIKQPGDNDAVITQFANSASPAGPATGPSTMASSEPSPTTASTAPFSGEGSRTEATSPENGNTSSDYYYPIADDIAEENLALFRRDMILFCPMVYIPPGMTSKELRRVRPCLWLSIMACTTRSMRQSHDIGDKLRQYISDRLVVGFERSVDFLQSLLVFMQWPHCHRNGAPFLSLWTNIGVALAQDLGLSVVKGETAFAYIKKFWAPKQQCKGDRHHPRLHSQEHTMEDRRTILSLYMWTSMLSQLVRKDNSLRWTPFMEESLRMLVERPEWEGDMILATQLRCTLVAQQITDIYLQQALLGQEMRIPMYFQQSLTAQLGDILRTVPASVAQHEAVLLHLYSTDLSIQELALDFGPQANAIEAIKQLESLQKCLNAVEHLFQTWEAIAPHRLIGLSFSTFMQKIQGLVALFRLSTLDNIPAWNKAEVRKRLDIFALLDRLENLMLTAAVATGVAEDDPGEDSLWRKAAKVMRRMRMGIKEDFPDMNDGLTVGQVPDLVSGGANLAPQDLQDPFMSNLADDPWLSAIFVPWDSMNF